MKAYIITVQQRECRYVAHSYRSFNARELQGWIDACKAMLPKGTYDVEVRSYDMETEKTQASVVKWVLRIDERRDTTISNV